MKRTSSIMQHLKRTLSGLLLFTTGLTADLWLGGQLLQSAHENWLLVMLHFPCVLIWGLGLFLITQARTTKKLERLTFLQERWSLTGLLIGLIPVPGLGTLSYSFALCISLCLGRNKEGEEKETETQGKEPYPRQSAILDLAIEPLIEHLHGTDLELKRAAVSVLGQQALPENTLLLRTLLVDAAAEIRSDASIALTRLDEEQAQSVKGALLQWESNPTEIASMLDLADAYYAYICSNVLDEISQMAYLLKARDLLLLVLQQQSTSGNLWLKLAKLQQRLGALEQAQQAVQQALNLGPKLPEYYALAMEIAFLQRDWNKVRRFAQAGLTLLEADNTLYEAFTWWATSPEQEEIEERYDKAS